MNQPRRPVRQLSEGRKALYYLGSALMVIGFLSFLSVFVSGALEAANPQHRFGGVQGRTEPIRAVVGFVLIIGGGVLAGIGKSGLAGAGVKLDPEQAREELEPWSRLSGGVMRDTLDEAGIDLAAIGSKLAESDLPFDEKLRRLHALHQDGILTEEEYRKEKQDLLDAN